LILLEGQGARWDGERFAALNARVFVHLGRDAQAAALTDMQAALEITRAHDLHLDESTAVRAIVPLLCGVGRGDEAEGLLAPLLARFESETAEEPAHEMLLHQIRVRVFESLGRFGSAIRAGLQALKRSGKVGDLRHYTGFVVQVASLYQQAGRPADAVSVLDAGVKALSARSDSAEWLATLEEARDALAADLRGGRGRGEPGQRGSGDIH